MRSRFLKALMLTAVLSSAFCFSAVHRVSAQQLGLRESAILTIEAERLFAESAFGLRVSRELEAESAVLAAENRQIEAELTAEEQELTDRRPNMEADAFRILADAFDEKVIQIRREQETKARDLSQKLDQAQIDFLNAVLPILERMMQEANAGVILERTSIFVSADSTDITDLAISRINQVLGDGAQPDSDSED